MVENPPATGDLVKPWSKKGPTHLAGEPTSSTHSPIMSSLLESRGYEGLDSTAGVAAPAHTQLEKAHLQRRNSSEPKIINS